MKTILLCMCVLFVAIATLSISNIATSSMGSPTTAPVEITGISNSTPTEFLIYTPPPIDVSVPLYPAPATPYPTFELYPAPVEQEDEINEFAQLIISIFGINHNGKDVQHK